MKKVSRIRLTGKKRQKQVTRELFAASGGWKPRFTFDEDVFKTLSKTTVGALDRKIKHGENLSYEEAFCGMCYVLGATNTLVLNALKVNFEKAYGAKFTKEKAIAIASAFLNLMATKEALKSLTYEEVAGMSAAAMLDPVHTFSVPEIIETCGMGGDKGFYRNGERYKSINASTLSAIVLSATGLPAVKHGSYGNTSAVGSTEMIESFGAKTDCSDAAEVMRIWRKTNFSFFDAHWCKTIHDLSHLLMMETVNHIVGPMTPPICKDTVINKLMGVNEKVAPETIARAYALLHMQKVQKVGGVLVICGLDATSKVVTDEVSPFTTVFSAAYQDTFLGNGTITPVDFGVEISLDQILVANKQKEIHIANVNALYGRNPHLVNYLAMNASLGMFAHTYMCKPDAVVKGKLNSAYLKTCFDICRKAIVEGRAKRVLSDYVRETGGVFIEG